MEELYDIHTHLWIQKNNLYNDNFFPRKLQIQELINSYNWLIQKIVTFPMPWTNINSSESIPYEVENIYLIQEIDRWNFNNIILPFISIHPRINVTEQLEVIVRLMRITKIYWLKFHTLDTLSYIDNFFKNDEIINFCKQYKLPILIHSANFDWFENCNNIFHFAEKYKDINILIAHMMWFSNIFFERLKNYKYWNLFFDCSPFLWMCKMYETYKNENCLNLNYANPKDVLLFLYKNFPNRLICGSDQPFWKFNIDSDNYVDFSINDELKLLFWLQEKIISQIANKNSKNFLWIK